MSAVPEPILKPGQTQQKKRKQAEVTATESGSGSAADTADTAAADATPAPAPAPAPQTDAADAAIAKRSRVEESNSEAADAAAKAADAAAVEPPQHEHMYAMVCRSNMNRSMANHDILERHGFKVCSYGIGREVKVPSRDKKGRMFPFGTPYKHILEALTKEDEKFNIASGVIPMLKRNKEIKEAPEDFRKIPDEFLRSVDVVICSEHDIFERVVEDIEGRDAEEFKPIHVLNLETTDNNEDAIKKSQALLQLCKLCSDTEDIGNDFPDVLEQFKEQYAADDELLYSLQYL